MSDVPVYIAQRHLEKWETYEGKFFNGEDYHIFHHDIDIYTDNQQLLCKFRKNLLTKKDTQRLFGLKSAAKVGYTRPSASGYDQDKYKYIVSKSSGKKLHVLTSKSTSGIVGFYDNTSHFGHYSKNHVRHDSDEEDPCRMTAFTTKHQDLYRDCLPVFQKINRWFRTLVPVFYQNQKKCCEKIDPQYVIPKTVFTTVTVNKNFRTALHKDAGDLKTGFGIMVVASDQETYTGCYTLFPEFKIGIDCRTGDFMAFDVHQWHCNSEMKTEEPPPTRLSFIFYVREKMLRECPL